MPSNTGWPKAGSGDGGKIRDVIACTEWGKDVYGDQLFVFAGKWEDGKTVRNYSFTMNQKYF
ncbi:hypothetical protein VV089_04225 [Candidatus Merdisoma sp. JLR.KK011]|uniref:hypothetical protein n=1 Tax=Candidatus Merdisoma sp. JLR.KK011 TaxID=3114299 RepID=UPI002FF3469F